MIGIDYYGLGSFQFPLIERCPILYSLDCNFNMRVNELDMSESTLLASWFRPVDYVTPLVFYSSYACRRPKKQGGPVEKNKTSEFAGDICAAGGS